MKYLLASLVLLPMQMLFLLAFTAFALSVGVATMAHKFAPHKVRAPSRLKYRRVRD